MNAPCVELPYIQSEQRFSLIFREIVFFSKFCGRFEIRLAACGLPVHVAKQFLQGVSAHPFVPLTGLGGVLCATQLQNKCLAKPFRKII